MSMTEQYPKLKLWNKDAGPKPTKKLLDEASTVARPGSKDAIAIAMALREHGTTQKQISSILGAPHRNKLSQLVARRQARRVPLPEKQGQMVYKIRLK